MTALRFLLPSRLLLSVPEFHQVHRITPAGYPEAAITGHGLTAAIILHQLQVYGLPITVGEELHLAPKVSNLLKKSVPSCNINCK